MVGDFILSLEPYVIFLVFIHVIISLVLSIILSRLVTKRFAKDTKKVQKIDAFRLEEIENESWVFKLFFKVALHKNNRITNILFMFIFNLSIPVIGYIFSIWITIYLKNVSYEKKVANTNILNLDEFGMSFLKVERIFGEGSMSDLMVSKYAPKSKKLKALSALANNPSPANLKIIRQTLASTDDEIRMFGYAIINKAEKSLNVKINYYLDIFNELNEEEDIEEDKVRIDRRKGTRGKEERIAEAAKELAPLYWEMIYTELSHESLKESFLKEVEKYINIARDFYSKGTKNIYEVIDRLENKIKDINEDIKNPSIVKKDKDIHETKRELVEALDLQKRKLIKYNEINTKLYVLMGRVYVKRGEFDNANTEFTIAQELHTVESSFILPYLAEIHFITGNYRVVSSIMKRASDLELNSTLYPIIEQWKAS
jgi:hypothetical protein